MIFPKRRIYRVSGGGGGKRSGLVQRNGRAVFDDLGAFYPLGLTFMWSLQGLKYEEEHYRANMRWAADKRFDFTRPLTEVGWQGTRRIDPTQPEWSDWHSILRRHLDIAYDEFGLRSGVTLSGKGTSTDLQWLAREVGAIIAEGRTHKVLVAEMQNEAFNGGSPLESLKGMARELRARVPNLIGLSAVQGGSTEEESERLAAEMKNAISSVGGETFIRHTERSSGDYGWRFVRQSYDFHNDLPLIGAHWEPPGPSSSVASLTNPLQLAMMRAVGIMCGAPIFILHTGTGVYGDGKPGSTGPRPPNFWEIDNIDAIVSAVRGIDALLPEGLPNWQVANTQWQAPLPVAPFQPHHHWEGDSGNGVNKAYSALAPDGRFVQMPCGVRGFATMTASYPLKDVTVFDPISLQAVASFPSFAKGGAFDLPGGGQDAMAAYIIHGRRA